MLIAGTLSAAGILFLVFKFGVRRVIAFDIPIDIVSTGFLMFMFAGTFSGMLTAMIAGLIISITLFVMKQTMTREVLSVVKTKKFPYRRFMWVDINPKD
jgi:membrane protein CcdC involved in cytochrome C biogenesis